MRIGQKNPPFYMEMRQERMLNVPNIPGKQRIGKGIMESPTQP